MLKITALSKNFGSLVAVNDLRLEVKPGEIFGFIGPNGAGKTTTIKLIAGLLKPTSGQVLIGGHDIHRDSVEAKRLIAFVPDEPYLYDKLTGTEFLALVGNLHGMERDDMGKRIQELIELFSIGEYANELTEGYSHGTRQKFVLAAAFLTRPKLILIDEPMVGLDPQNSHLVKVLLQKISKEHHVSIFMSTHTLSLAQEICHRIGIIHHGRLEALGRLQELQDQAHAANQNLEQLYLKLTGQSQYDKISW